MKTISKLIKLIRSLFPSRLPVGLQEFNAWAEEIISLAKAPDNDSVRFALAAMIVNSDVTKAYQPKMFFILQLRKGMANQVASHVMYESKKKQAEQQQEEARKAAEEQQKASSLEQQS